MATYVDYIFLNDGVNNNSDQEVEKHGARVKNTDLVHLKIRTSVYS